MCHSWCSFFASDLDSASTWKHSITRLEIAAILERQGINFLFIVRGKEKKINKKQVSTSLQKKMLTEDGDFCSLLLNSLKNSVCERLWGLKDTQHSRLICGYARFKCLHLHTHTHMYIHTPMYIHKYSSYYFILMKMTEPCYVLSHRN